MFWLFICWYLIESMMPCIWISILHIRTIFLSFTPCDGWLRECGLCVPHIYNPVEQEVMAGQFHAPSHPGVLKHVNMNGNTSEIFHLQEFLGVPIIMANIHWRKTCISQWFFPHFQLFYFNDRLEFCEFLSERSKW